MTRSAKYGKPIWSLVLEASRIVSQPFTAESLVEKVHETHPDIPSVSISTYVRAMAPNHPTAKYYPSTSKNHGHFTYLGNGKFQLSIISPHPVTPPEANDKEAYLAENRNTTLSWLQKNKDAIIKARREYVWENNSPLEALEKRRSISRRINQSRIRNGGGVDLKTINVVMDWGGMRHFPISDPSEALRISKEAFSHLDEGDLKGATCILLQVYDFGIAGASKLLGLSDGERYCIYDSRVGTALNTLCDGDRKIILAPTGRSRPGDSCPKLKWADQYERLTWILEVMRDQLNTEGYPFNIADLEMALFMLGK